MTTPREVEEWRQAKGYPNYRVSSLGRVKSVIKGKERLLKPQLTSYGYLRVTTYNNKCSKSTFVHKLVLESFIKIKPKGLICRHINGVRTDNRVENLKWGTHKQNYADTVTHGRASVGDRHGEVKIPDSKVESIRRAYKRTHYHKSNAQYLADKYSVNKTTIMDIVNGVRKTAREALGVKGE